MMATVSTTFCYNKEEPSDELRVFCRDLFLSGEAVLDSEEWLDHASASSLFTLPAPVIGQIWREIKCLILCHIQVKWLQNEDALSNVLLFTDTEAKEQLINPGTAVKTPLLAHS